MKPSRWDDWWSGDGFFVTLKKSVGATTVSNYLHSLGAYILYAKVRKPQRMNCIIQLESRQKLYGERCVYFEAIFLINQLLFQVVVEPSQKTERVETMREVDLCEPE